MINDFKMSQNEMYPFYFLYKKGQNLQSWTSCQLDANLFRVQLPRDCIMYLKKSELFFAIYIIKDCVPNL